MGKLAREGEVVDGGPHEIILIETSIDAVELSLILWIEPVEGTRRRLQLRHPDGQGLTTPHGLAYLGAVSKVGEKDGQSNIGDHERRKHHFALRSQEAEDEGEENEHCRRSVEEETLLGDGHDGHRQTDGEPEPHPAGPSRLPGVPAQDAQSNQEQVLTERDEALQRRETRVTGRADHVGNRPRDQVDLACAGADARVDRTAVTDLDGLAPHRHRHQTGAGREGEQGVGALLEPQLLDTGIVRRGIPGQRVDQRRKPVDHAKGKDVRDGQPAGGPPASEAGEDDHGTGSRPQSQPTDHPGLPS